LSVPDKGVGVEDEGARADLAGDLPRVLNERT
jgi:hypothetical protein